MVAPLENQPPRQPATAEEIVVASLQLKHISYINKKELTAQLAAYMQKTDWLTMELFCSNSSHSYFTHLPPEMLEKLTKISLKRQGIKLDPTA